MGRIYVHYGKKEFNKEEFCETQQKNVDKFLCCDKRPFDLWGSVFNEFGTWSYERLIGCEFIENTKREIRMASDKERAQFFDFLYSIGSNENIFFEMPPEEQSEMLKKYTDAGNKPIDQQKVDAWNIDCDFAKLELYEQMKLACQKHRENAFYFVVNQDKILHVECMDDIAPYLTKHNIHTFDLRNNILFDKLMKDGYAGIELHYGDDYANMHFGTVFKSWPVDSLMLWDVSEMTVISPEIAHIARLATNTHLETNDAILIFDKYDPLMNVDGMIDWIQNHQTEVQQAIDDGFITIEDVADLINQKYDSSGKQQGQDPMELEQDYEELETSDNQQQYDIIIERP